MNTVMMMIANATVEDAATALQAAGISATIHASTGVGAWGIEHGITVILGRDDIARAYRAVEAATGIDEEAVYVVPMFWDGQVVATAGM